MSQNPARPEGTPPTAPTKTKAAVILLMAGVMALFVWIQFYRDEPPRVPAGYTEPDPRPIVEDSKSGMHYLETEFRARGWPTYGSKVRPGGDMSLGKKPWEYDAGESTLDQGPILRVLLEKALTYPFWRGASGYAGPMSISVRVFKMTNEQIHHLADQGNLPEAMEWVELARRVSAREMELPDTLISYWRGLINGRGQDVLLMRVLAREGIPPEMLERAAAWLEKSVYDRSVLRRALQGSYEDLKSWELDELLTMLNDSRTYNKTTFPAWLGRSRLKRQAFYNLGLEQCAMIDRLCGLRGPDAVTQWDRAFQKLDEERNMSLWTLDPKAASRALAADRSLGNVEAGRMIILDLEAYRGCCRAAVAAKRWALAHGGKRPALLQDLVPEYLTAPPIDPRTDQPIKWDAATGTAYLIGQDGVDDVPVFARGEVSVIEKSGTGARLP